MLAADGPARVLSDVRCRDIRDWEWIMRVVEGLGPPSERQRDALASGVVFGAGDFDGC